MTYTHYNIIFAYYEDNLWTVANPQKKTIETLSMVDFQERHDKDNIYIIFNQRHEILEAGSYVYFDLCHRYSPTLERIAICYGVDKTEAMIKYFLDERQADFNAHFNLIDTYRLPMWNIGKTTAGLSAEIMQAVRRMLLSEDKEIKNLKIEQYKDIASRIGTDKFNSSINDVECEFGMGGIHGARKKYNASGVFYNMDVVSMYPSIMINDDLLSRSANKERYQSIYDQKLKCQDRDYEYSLKIILNSTFGAMNEPHSALYDPNRFKLITKFGQLYILDLIENLWPFDLIQTNTDSVLIRLDGSKIWSGHDIEILEQELSNICLDWQIRTGLTLSFTKIYRVYQKDVNNYIFVTDDDRIIAKGAYANKQKNYNRQTRVIIEALRNKIVYNTEPWDTIKSCNDLDEFGFYANLGNKYSGFYIDNDYIPGEAIKVYAGLKGSGGKLKKKNKRTGKLEKVAGSPDICTIYPANIDKGWYEQETQKRLKSFGL